MPTNSNTTKHEEEENPLRSLLNKDNQAFGGASLMRVIRRDFELVKEVREKGIRWREIVEALGFQGMEARARYSFFYEKRRRAKKKEKEVMPEKKKWIPDPKDKAKTEKEIPGPGGPAPTGTGGVRLLRPEKKIGVEGFDELDQI